ncbi:apolipoprotein B-100-like [Pholidichthys leucotaenia]
MWGVKLCLVLLLGTYTLAQQDIGSIEEQSPVCFLAKRYRNFRRFVYNYEAESFNGVNGATNSKSGPKVSCTVEVDVPQTCSFIIRTTECSLTEISDTDDEGAPVYRPAAGSKAFKAAMQKNSLKITVEGQTDVKLYPEGDEPINILNVKRGIVSALMVPATEEEKNKEMPTVHGLCSTDFTTDSKEDVTISRDVSRCDGFVPQRQDTSPLALVSGMKYSLSKLISSTQTCNYKFDSQKKHMTSGTCTEKHIFLPLSHQNEYGISAVVKQTLILRETSKINDRVFDITENIRYLPMDAVDDKSPVQTKDAVISTMQKLNTLSQTTDGEERAGLFHKLVSELSGLKADVLDSVITEMSDISSSLTWQAVAQCGTPECTSALLKLLRTFHPSAVEVDAVVYALGLLPNPSRLMVKDLLEMARYKQSKLIMYALSNVARKLYLSEGVTPEITAVSEFMASLLGADCAGEKELIFLTLRVVGNMGDAMEAADPTIKTTLVKCMRQPATTLSVQLAAIQAFRRMSVTDEARSNLQRVCQYPKGAVQKRLAAYLVLMRNPEDSDTEMVKKLLTQEQNVQIKSFVSSHIYNIISSTDSETQELGQRIKEALEDTEVSTHDDYTTKSRNYKLDMAHENMQASVQGNVIFDPSSQIPREVLLETTLKVFGYSMDIWELGMEGKTLEPTIDAFFGPNGFFPDTVSKAMYWAEDRMPQMREVLNKFRFLKKEDQKVHVDDMAKEIVRNFNRLINELQTRVSPEVMAYVRIMGAELGYIKNSELKSIAENAVMYADIFMRIIPTKVMASLLSRTDNDIFVHYIFMDNKFTLPTASGLPLKFALSGTFAPGAKGGLRISPKMNELVFMPSVGVEFVTQMGVHMPEFVTSAIEMRTSMYHESALKAKITMEQKQVKLSIPAPQGTTKFLRISNKVMIVGAEFVSAHPQSGESSCSPLVSGVKYCIHTRHPDTADNAPYFLLNGESRFSLDIKPTNEVSEYTASIAYDLLSEGKEGRQKVDSLTFTLRTEGTHPSEATATMKYNRNKNVFTTQVQIPDLDVEAGMKIGMSDSSAKGRSVTLELSNKNVPQLTLTGLAKVQGLTDGMLQVQLLVPALKTDATLTAATSKADGLILEIKSDVKLPESSSFQAIIFKYGEDQAEVQLMSNMNADTKIPLSYTKALVAWTSMFVAGVMDRKVVNTDMRLHHIFNKGIEASKIWMDKISADAPFVSSLRNKIRMADMPSVPENVFMNFEGIFRYQFNQDHLTIAVPLPFGGKSSEELRIPRMVTSPHILVPELGIDFAPRGVHIPSFTIPSEYDLTLPLMGMLDMSAKLSSNYYNWEAMVSAGNNTAESPNYLAKFNVKVDSPIEVFSFTAEGATKLTDTAQKTMEFTLDGSLNHMLINTGFDVQETIAISDSVLTTGRYGVNAFSPLGLDTSLTITTQMTLDSSKLFGDVNTDGSLSIGPMMTNTTYLHTFYVEPAKKEAKMESTLRLHSDILRVGNKIKASYADEELLLESNTNVNGDPIKHTTKMSLRYKEVRLTIQSDSVTKADDKMLRSQIEFAASREQASLRIENRAEDTVNRAYSLVTGFINPSGLEINADASANIFSSLASHKATLALTKNGLTTSCTTTAKHSPLTFENVYHGGIDASGATMSLTMKGGIQENKAELTIGGKIGTTEIYLNSNFEGNVLDLSGRNSLNFRVNEDGLTLSTNMIGSFKEMRTDNTNSLSFTLKSFTLQSKTDNFLDDSNSYKHDITVNMQRYIVSVMMKNDLKVMEISFKNDAHFEARPYNMELTGMMMGAFSEEELKHTYDIKFIDMALSAKYNTNGKLLGSHITHATDIEVAALTLKLHNDAKFDSPSFRLDSSIKANAAPFTLNIDAMLNSNGAVYLCGRQSGELYSKFILKAEPLLFTQSLEYRTSSTHELEGRPTIKTNMDNKFNSMLNLQEQSVSLKMTSRVNEHTFEQEMSAYNNAERMGIEMAGAVSTPFLSDGIKDYAISGFIKYDKNSDSHFLQIPFIEHLPSAIEHVKTTMMKVMDFSIEMLKDFDKKYEISTKFQMKMAELKEVIDNFDFGLFIQDLRKYIYSVENFITNVSVKLPTEKIMNALKSFKHSVVAWIQKCNIAKKFNVIFAQIEEILSSYEVEKMIGNFMDEVVKIMKQYHVREKIHHVFDTIRSIDIKPFVKKMMAPVQELVDELYAFDFKQLIDDMGDYLMRIIQKIRSVDYDKITMELKEKVADMSKIPCFGKLYGQFRVASPHYKLTTTVDLENTTTTSDTPEFKMNLNSRTRSTLRILDLTVDASAHVAAPKMSHLSISENIKVNQSCFTLDHKGKTTLYGLTAQASADTTATATTELYVAKIVNKATFTMENGVSATMETTYKQDLTFPFLDIFTDSMISQKVVFVLKADTVSLTINNLANEKYAIQDLSDEVNHKSDMEVLLIDIHTAKVKFTGETDSSYLKMSQNVVADVCLFSHVIIDAKAKTETPFMKNSAAGLKLHGSVEDMKIEFTASHEAELVGQTEGTLSNSAHALISYKELVLDTKNKGNVKISLPFKLSGKTDLQNDIIVTLNSEVQQASWTGLARFNQYKYSHYFALDNGEQEINLYSQIKGEANLDVLKERFTIPEMYLPYLDIRTPRVVRFSLWEDTGLDSFLITTKQTFDMDSKLKYIKNHELFTYDINMGSVIDSINTNLKALHKKVIIAKDRAAVVLATPYDKAVEEYAKYSNKLPKTITVPAYKIPVMNVEMSTFTIPMPDFTFVTTPVWHLPSVLRKLNVQRFTLPRIYSITIPVLGDLEYEFAMKTPMITLKTDANILRQDGIVIKLGASSSSEFEILSGKINANIHVVTVGGLNMASAVTVQHVMLEGYHESTFMLSRKNIGATITNSAKVNLHELTMEIKQEITGNPEEGLVVSVSSPAAGLIGVQMQTKQPAQVKTRLYGRYPSEPEKDITILGLKMSVVNSESLNLQTTWNMEIPFEVMHGLKGQVPVVIDMVYDPAVSTYNEICRKVRHLEPSFEEAKKQGEIMFKRAVENLSAANPSKFMSTVIDKTIFFLKEYQRKVEIILNAVVRFLRETKFQFPGHKHKMSGLEVYQKFNAFVADVSEEAILKISEIASMFTEAHDLFQTTEFKLPGSNRVVTGKEILDDLFVALRKFQDKVISAVRKLGKIQLEDVMKTVSAFTQFTTEQMEKLFETLKSQNVEELSRFVSDVYSDAMSSPVMVYIIKQIEEVHRIIMEYLKAVKAKLYEIINGMTNEQLIADIQSWIDSLAKRINIFQNSVVTTLKENSRNVEKYVKVSDRKVEVDIPLPFADK